MLIATCRGNRGGSPWITECILMGYDKLSVKLKEENDEICHDNKQYKNSSFISTATYWNITRRVRYIRNRAIFIL